MNWDDLLKVANEAGFTLTPIGEYDVVVDKAEATQSKGSDTAPPKEMIKVWFRVTTGPQAGKGGIINRFTLSPDNPTALGFFFRELGHLGLDEAYFKAQGQPRMAQIAADLVGRQCRIKLGHRQFGDTMQHNVEKVMAPSVPQAPVVYNGSASPLPGQPGQLPPFNPPPAASYQPGYVVGGPQPTAGDAAVPPTMDDPPF